MRCSALVLVLVATNVGVAQDDAGAAFARGSAAFEQENYEEALLEFRRAYELAPHDAVRGSIGRCLERMGRFEEALVEYEAVAASDQVPEADREHAGDLSARVRARLAALQAERPEEVDDEPDDEPVDEPADESVEVASVDTSPSLWLTATAGSLAIGATAAAVGLGLRGQTIESDYMNAPTQSLLDQGRRFQRTTNAMWGVAITAAVVAVVDLIIRVTR